jgi:hypothetical protein
VKTRSTLSPLGDRGERLAASALRHRGFRVRHLGPRAHDWDLIAEKEGRKLKIQVKTIGSGSWQCGSATKYIKINLIDERQEVTGRQVLSDPEGVYIFVSLEGQKTFYLMRLREVQHLVYIGYKTNLRRHDYKRPKNRYTFHHAVSMMALNRWKDNWEILSK